MVPSADRGRPCGFMVTAIELKGTLDRPRVVRPCGLKGPAIGHKEGSFRALPMAHEASWARGCDGRGASLGDKPCPHEARGISESDMTGPPLREERQAMRPH